MANFIYESNEDIFPSRIETERLVMEKMSFESVSIIDIYEMYKNIPEHVTEYVTFSQYESPIEAKRFVEDSMGSFESGESAGYFISLRNSDHERPFIGTTGFSPRWEQSIAESGIFLFEDYWGNGYSAERGEAMLELAFKEYDFEYWISRCHPENEGSIRAIEKYVVENGGKRVGVLPNHHNELTESGEYEDALFFKLDKESYKSATNG